MVATWMSDCSTNHEIFVLIGPQGIYKTTFFRHLLPPPLRTYFWENAHNSFASKDDHLALAENCIVEIEEIDLQNPRDISELKALATSEKVKERRPYARFREERHRLASFCAVNAKPQIIEARARISEPIGEYLRSFTGSPPCRVKNKKKTAP